MGTAASLVAAGKGDAVVFAESAASLGDDNEELVEAASPGQIYVVGGTRAVSASVENRLRALAPGVSITRFAGSDRIHTAALAADEVLAGRSAPSVIIANGWSLPDVGAAAAAVAAGAADVVLYAQRNRLGEPTSSALKRHRPSSVLIAGGFAAVSPAVGSEVAAAAGSAKTTRLGGATRIETAALIAETALPRGADNVVVANGWSLPDVGAAAALAAALPNSAVLYTAPNDPQRAAANTAIRRLAKDRIVVVDTAGSLELLALTALVRFGPVTRISHIADVTRAALGQEAGEAFVDNDAIPAAAIRDAEAYMVELVNDLRAGLGVSLLEQHDGVAQVARQWSNTMYRRGVFEHNSTFSAEYPRGSIRGGENIAFVPFSGRQQDLRAATLSAFEGLSDSPGHYRNMIDGEFAQIGVGIAARGGAIWVTQNFACYPPDPQTRECGDAPEIDVDEASDGLPEPSSLAAPDPVDEAVLTAPCMDDSKPARYVDIEADRYGETVYLIRTDGSLGCLQDGSRAYARAVPAGRFTDVTAGWKHVCGLRTDKTLACWKKSLAGFSGLNPVLRPPSGAFEAVAAGKEHACAIRESGSVVCWGDNTWGQADAPGGKFTDVKAGGNFSCGVRADSSAHCWGGFSDAPSGKFVSLEASNTNVCGVREDRTAACWAGDTHLVLAGEFSHIHPLAYYWGRDQLVCGIRLDGSAECLQDEPTRPDPFTGLNGEPVGRRILESSTPRDRFVRLSASITGFNGVVRSCGLKRDQTVVCWGQRWESSLGTGLLNRDGSDFDVLSTLGIVKLSNGSDRHTGCGVRADASAVCWAESVKSSADSSPAWKLLAPNATFNEARDGDLTVDVYSGQYSDVAFATDRRSTPYKGFFGDEVELVRVICLLDVNGTISCPNSATMDEAFEGETFTDLVGTGAVVDGPAGAFCAIRSNRTIFCRHTDAKGPLGQTPTGEFASLDIAGYSGLGTGDYACAIRVDGGLSCWGEVTPDFGNIPGNQAHAAPTPPAGRFSDVDVAPDYACASRVDATVQCWGWLGSFPASVSKQLIVNYRGHFGREQFYRQTRPGARVITNSRLAFFRPPTGGFASVAAAGDGVACGIRSGGGMQCWGPSRGSDAGGLPPHVPKGSFVEMEGVCGLSSDSAIACAGTLLPKGVSWSLGQVACRRVQLESGGGSSEMPAWSATDVACSTVSGTRPNTNPTPQWSFQMPVLQENNRRWSNYPMDFLRRYQSQPDDCWVYLYDPFNGGLAYDITPGAGRYEYPGSEPIAALCATRATEHFWSTFGPPGAEYIEGQIRD